MRLPGSSSGEAPQRGGWPEGARRGPPGRRSFCPEPPSLEDHCKARRYAPVAEHATTTITQPRIVRSTVQIFIMLQPIPRSKGQRSWSYCKFSPIAKISVPYKKSHGHRQLAALRYRRPAADRRMRPRVSPRLTTTVRAATTAVRAPRRDSSERRGSFERRVISDQRDRRATRRRCRR